MSEWHISPEYILATWTEPQLLLWFTKRRERLEVISETMQTPGERRQLTPKRISADELFAQLGSGIKKVH